MKGTADYLKDIEKALKRGDATEHTYRPALKSFIETLATGITATNEPKREDCGAPDFIVTKRNVPIGYIEAKDVGKSLDKAEDSEQLKRYFESLNNMILTDYLEFRWYVDGKSRLIATLAKVDKDGKLRKTKDGEKELEELLTEFISKPIPVITGPKELAKRMAGLAKLIKDVIAKALADDTDENGGMLYSQMKGFRDVLLSGLTKEPFADMYAQTICYGLFAARCSRTKEGRFTREHAAYDLPKTNPFLRQMFTHIAGPELDDRVAWAVDDLAELLNRVDIGKILEDFGKRTQRQDPVLHFYETFLAAYDPKMREARGVYYTPEPVVSYMVRSVDHILKTDFGLKDGLADTSKVRFKRVVKDPETGEEKEVEEECHKVLILDPAVGTGTFLHGVIDHIHEHEVEKGRKGAWSSYVSSHLLPRLFGFELLMAPYTVAHMKLGIQLKELGYDFKSDERLGIYLTNTLQEADEITGGPIFATWLTKEANAAVKVKLDLPILVVLGNPPYSGISANMSNKIVKLVDAYKVVDGKPLKERKTWLQDDYVKFFRFVQQRIEKTGQGVLSFISNNGYLDNPTFRGMRQSLMGTFDNIYILNLHGSSKKKELAPDGTIDKNVFDIQQGVAISVFIKKPDVAPTTVNIKYNDIWGNRDKKYKWLNCHDIRDSDWAKTSPHSPYYMFVPQAETHVEEYSEFISIKCIFHENVAGIVTARDHFVVDIKKDALIDRLKVFRDSNNSDQEIRDKFFSGKGASRYPSGDTRGWKLPEARKRVRSDKDLSKNIKDILYRPFDIRSIYYTYWMVDWPRLEMMSHVLGGRNVAVSTTRSIEIGRGWEHVFCTDKIIQHHTVSLKEVNYLFPLYLYPPPEKVLIDNDKPSDAPGGRKPNLSEEFINDFSSRLKMEFIPDGKGDLKKTFGPEDVFDYTYAVFHSPTYRSRYAEFLKIDFPRLPLTSSKALFRKLCTLGGELVGLHLMEEHGPAIAKFEIEDGNEVEKVRYTEPGQGADQGRVWINKTQFFDSVPPEIWNFHIGGYQVCNKWLKDRKGRKLTYDDITHYQGIVSALSETIRIMAEIDKVIDKHGGWPIK